MVDIPDNTSTTATVAVGAVFSGQLELADDKDWIAVTLVAGQSYAISLATPGQDGVNDTFVSIFDSLGNLLASDDDGGNGLDSLASFTPATSGTYFIEAKAFGNGTGSYEVAVTESGPPSFLDSIDWGTKVDTNTINVYFAPRGEVLDGHTSRGWSKYEIQQTMLALQQFSNVCDVTFDITRDATQADFKLATDTSRNLLGYFNPPGTGRHAGEGVMFTNGTGWDEAPGGGLEQGGYGFITLIHELGHGMGLAHPHDGGGSSTTWEGVTGPFDSLGTFDLNQGIYTVMSYNDGWQLNPDGLPPGNTYGWQGTMMAFDVAMLQQKYGANTTFRNGDDIYRLNDQNASGTFFACIWDTGGTDEIIYDGAADATINLNAAHLGYAEGSGGYITSVAGIFGGFTIANGVMIEKATGGTGDDILWGNDGRNTLSGRGGSDLLMGWLGRDVLLGGSGGDVFQYLSLQDSGATAKSRDVIGDFRSGTDLIDLAALDARNNGTDNDAFVWIDSAAFNSVRGELRWVDTAKGVVVEADRDGNGAADFTMFLAGIHSVVQNDFLL